MIETQDHCGLLPLTVIRRSDALQRPLTPGSVEVRSLKLGYREHYRGMLSYIAEKCAGLLLDCRTPTRSTTLTHYGSRVRILEQQLEFLRYTLKSPAFGAAVEEVLRNPHRRLGGRAGGTRHLASVQTRKRLRSANRCGIAPRVAVPRHIRCTQTVQSLPAHVSVRSRFDFLDTAETRFAKMVLFEFLDFLSRDNRTS